MSNVIEELRWKKFPVLNDGFVCLVDVMGDDSSIVQAARVSYGNELRLHIGNPEVVAKLNDLFPKGGESSYGSPDPMTQEWVPGWSSQQISTACEHVRQSHLGNDRNLIRYLMRHRHTTPFEMAEIKLLVRVPMDCWRQWIRHRTANVNEYSTRYSIAIDSCQMTDPEEWRIQSDSNKQGSGGRLIDQLPKDKNTRGGRGTAEALSGAEKRFIEEARKVYQERIDAGIAKEQARKDLPLSTYTEAYWKCDLHNVLHFLGLRMDSHAQVEIRQYATIIGEQIIKPLFPMVWEAFEDYRLGAMYLTRQEVDYIGHVMNWYRVRTRKSKVQEHSGLKGRELDELMTKLARLNVFMESDG